MTQPQKNSTLVFGIVAGVLSLPLKWMTIRGAKIQGDFGDLDITFGEMNLGVTGLNGTVTLLFESPLWFIIGVAIGANALQFVRNSRVFAVPRIAEWAAAIFAILWIGSAVVLAVFSGNATLGIGALLGLAS